MLTPIQDGYQAHATSQLQRNRQALIEEINDAHDHFMLTGKTAAQALADHANAARNTGIFLTSLRAEVRHGEWLGLFSTHHGVANVSPVIHFSHQRALYYMNIAAKFPKPITVETLPAAARYISDLMQAAEILPESSRGEQHSRGLHNWLTQLQRLSISAFSIIGKEFEKRPDFATWERPQIEGMAELLKPFAEKYAEAQKALNNQ